MKHRNTNTRNRGFTLVECTVTLAVIAILLVIVAQAVLVSMRERARAASRQAAVELAANVLEEARVQPWDQLNQAWADGRTVPSEMSALLIDGKMIVKVEPDSARTRRVNVEIRWKSEHDAAVQSVQMSTLLSAREAKKIGGKP